MPYYIYILKSEIKDKYYIGSTSNIERRLILHNNGNSISTKAFIPWRVVYFEVFKTKNEALKREQFIKKQKSRTYILDLINK